jgi:hypothetical protein
VIGETGGAPYGFGELYYYLRDNWGAGWSGPSPVAL